MADDIGGVWRTVGGRRIFIKDGQDLASAMKESGKFGSAKNDAKVGHISVDEQKEAFGDKWEENDELLGDFTGDQKLFTKNPELAEQLNAIIDDYPQLHWSQGALYRGMGLSDDDFSQLQEGAVFSQRADNVAPSSWTSDEGVARRFTEWDATRGNKVILVEDSTPIKNGISIKASSGVPKEDEVIYNGNQNMIIRRIEANFGVTYVYVEEHSDE